MKIKLPRFGKTEIAILIVALIAVAFLSWVYFFWLIWEEKEFNLGPTKEARSNRYFAAQEFLQRIGIDNHISYSPTAFEEMRVEDEAIEVEDTIILLQGRGVINEQRFAKLWPWIEAGGTLVMSSENPWYRGNREEDALFTHLGIQSADHEDPFFEEEALAELEELEDEEAKAEQEAESSDQEATEDPDNADADNTDAEKEKKEAQSAKNKDYQNKDYLERTAYFCKSDDLEEIVFEGEARPLNVDFSWADYFYLEEGVEPDYFVDDEYGFFFAYYTVGEGRIFVNASNRIWQNPWIACHDHAYLLKKIVGESAHVWFIVNREAPSIVNLVWKGIPLAVIACFLALVLAVWRAALRFGPTFPDKDISRRSFAEHIKASADFFWRNGLQQELVEQLRREITIMLGRRNPGFETLRDEEKIQCLQKHCDLSAEVLQLVYLEPSTATTKKDFVFIVNKLKMIKEQL